MIDSCPMVRTINHATLCGISSTILLLTVIFKLGLDDVRFYETLNSFSCCNSNTPADRFFNIYIYLQEWDKPRPGRRPDIFPQFSPMKTPLPPPMPADPPEEDEEEFEKKEGEEEEEEEKDPDKEDPEQ